MVQRKLIVRLLVAVVLLALLFLQINIKDVAIALSLFQWQWLLVVIALFFLVIFLQAHRWKVLLACHALHIPFVTLVQFVLLGVMYNNILPSSAGGELARAIHLSRHERVDMSRIFSTVVIEKVGGLIALVVYLWIAIWYNLEIVESAGVWHIIVITVGLLLFSGAIFFSRRAFEFVTGLFHNKRNRFARVITRYYEAIHSYRDYIPEVVYTAILSFLTQGLMILIHYVIVRGLGLPLSFTDLMLVVPLVLLTNVIPVSFGNWGWRESVYVYILNYYVIAGASSLVLALMIRLVQFLMSLFGLVVVIGRKDIAPVVSQ